MKRAVFLLIAMLACSDDDGNDDDAPTSHIHPRMFDRPDDLLVRIEIGPRALQRLSEQLESPLLREVIPASPTELVRRIDPSPRNVDDGARMRVALVGDWFQPRVGVGFGSNGLRDATASDARLLDEARPWLRDHDSIEEISVFLADEAMASLRRVSERVIADRRREALDSIRLEASRHEEPPAFGDPAALVDWLAERAMSYVAYVSDLEAAYLTIHLDPLEVKGVLKPRADSPAARAHRAEGHAGIPTIPRGAALAWWRATPRPGWAQLFEATAGERLSDDGRSRLAELRGQPTDELMLALGYHDAPYALVRSPHELSDVEGILNLPHVRTLASMFRCTRVSRVRIRQPLCEGGPTVLFMGGQGHVLAISDSEEWEFLFGDGSQLLPIEASGVVWFDASRLAPASGLWREASSVSVPPRETPLVLHWDALAEQVEFEIDFTPGSLSAFADAFMAASDP